MLSTLRAVAEHRLPGLFAKVSWLADHRAAKNPFSELNLLPLFVERDDLVCDIGANRGTFTYWLLHLGARVVAVEPNPQMASVLERRFRQPLAEGRLKLFRGALSDRDGMVTLYVPTGFSPLATIHGQAISPDMPGDKVDVPCMTLDACVAGPVSFVKIDVEGHEQQVVDGGARLLATERPTLMIEAEERHRPGAVASLRRSLEPLGYEGFFALREGMQPIAGFDPAIHQRREALNDEGTAAREPFGYINNFVFVARSVVRERLVNWLPGASLLRA